MNTHELLNDIPYTLNIGGNYCVLEQMRWVDIKPSVLKDCCWSIVTCRDFGPEYVLELKGTPAWSEAEPLKDCALLCGSFHFVNWLYLEFEFNISELFDKFDLSVDDLTPISPNGSTRDFIQLNAMFNNAVLSGNRFVRLTEDRIKGRYGKESEQLRQWVEDTHSYYDHSLAYAFCSRVRNIIEHQYTTVSIVNIDTARGVCGYAINFENEYLDLVTNANHRKQVERFVAQRREQGLVPWLSVGDTLKRYRACITGLYLRFLGFLDDEADECFAKIAELPSGLGANCLVKHIPRTGQKRQPVHKLYLLPIPGDRETIKWEIERILRIIEENYKEPKG